METLIAHPLDAHRKYLFRAITLAMSLGACSSAGNGPLSYDDFKARAYHDPETDTYVINGDELVDSEQAMHAAYDRYVGSQAGISEVEQGLTVNAVNGHDDTWSPCAAASLTYCVSRSSFGARYNAVVSGLDTAAANWEATANVNFVHDTASDANCSAATSGVVFNVRQVTGTSFPARSFFPNTARANRELLIDAKSFGDISPLTLAGVMRHELGHTIGLRHEQVRPEAGGLCPEDSNWRAVTTYDSASVMHYPKCNGTNTGDLVLTARDKSGARSLYPSGSFQAFYQAYPGLDFGLPSPWQTVAGDFNGDGKTDYARLGDAGAFYFTANGNGTFAQHFQTYEAPIIGFGLPSTYEPITGDFDGDGKADYLRVGDGGAWLFYGRANAPNGFVQGFQAYQPPILGFGQPSAWHTITGDFDGDGKTDYARLGDTGAWVFYGAPTAPNGFAQGFQTYEAPIIGFGLPSPWKPVTGDFNGDHRTDYALLGDGGAWVFYGTTSRNVPFIQKFQTYESPIIGFGVPSPWDTITGDFNGDGRMDYARLGDTGAWVFYGSTNMNVPFSQSFQTYESPIIGFGLPSTWKSVTADFNGDGRTDYARLGDTGAWVFYGSTNMNVPFSQEFQSYVGQEADGYGPPPTSQVVAGKFTNTGRGGYARLFGPRACVFVHR